MVIATQNQEVAQLVFAKTQMPVEFKKLSKINGFASVVVNDVKDVY